MKVITHFNHTALLKETDVSPATLSQFLQESLSTFQTLYDRYKKMPTGREKQQFLTRLRKADREITVQLDEELKAREVENQKAISPAQEKEKVQEQAGKESNVETPSGAAEQQAQAEVPVDQSEKAVQKKTNGEVLAGEKIKQETQPIVAPKTSAPAEPAKETNSVAPPAPQQPQTPTPELESARTAPQAVAAPRIPEIVTPSPVKVQRQPVPKMNPAEWLYRYFATGKKMITREKLREFGYTGPFHRVVQIGNYVLTRSMFGRDYNFKRVTS